MFLLFQEFNPKSRDYLQRQIWLRPCIFTSARETSKRNLTTHSVETGKVGHFWCWEAEKGTLDIF